jgi:uncharacterized membrane protein YbhN (UPF0104 family)
VRELGVLAHAGTHWAPVSHPTSAAWAAIAVSAITAATYLVARARRGRRPAEIAGHLHALRQLADLVRRPGRVTTLVLASAGTTFVLAAAFALIVLAVVGTAAPSVAALMVVYLVGAAAGSAAHLPAVTGSTEIALTAALVASGVPAGAALGSVLLFRGLTYWAPLPAGILALRTLRRRGAL